MSKKLVGAIVAVSLLAAVVFVGYRVAVKNEIIYKYPKAEYLSEQEASKSPAYGTLTDEEKSVYTAVFQGIEDRQEVIPLPFDVTDEMYSKLYCILEKQESQYFYIESSYYTAETIRKARVLYRESDNSDIDEKIHELDMKKSTAIGKIPKNADDYQKALSIHDYIIKNTDYTANSDDPYSSTAYGCLVEGVANCEGYAKAFDLLATEVGLDCVVLTGITDKGENHAWNQVKIEGDWYNIDVTWDDAGRGEEPKRVYFLCNDEDFGKTHREDGYYLKPFECSEISQNYYVKEGFYARNTGDAKKIIARELEAGNNVIPLKFSNSVSYVEFRSRFIEQQEIFDLIFDSGEKRTSEISISLSENEPENCMVVWIL